MPSGEQEPSPEPSKDPQGQERLPYYRAARFASEQTAYQAYRSAERCIYGAFPCDLSAFRFQFSRISHVAILGEAVAPAVERELQAILSKGERVELRSEILLALQQRRDQATKLGPWVERHYRPERPR